MNKMNKFLLLVVPIIFVTVTSAVGMRWYQYVTNTESAYDEVGIALNGYMPLSLRTWGCAKLKANFSKGLPPYGCSDATGKNWLQ